MLKAVLIVGLVLTGGGEYRWLPHDYPDPDMDFLPRDLCIADDILGVTFEFKKDEDCPIYIMVNAETLEREELPRRIPKYFASILSEVIKRGMYWLILASSEGY